MINPERLKRVLRGLVRNMYPHSASCNLSRDRVGCTCDREERADAHIRDIERLEEE